jgi:hypothetical protein
MSGRARAGLLAAAVVIAVVAFILLQPDDESSKSDNPSQSAATTTEQSGGTPAQDTGTTTTEETPPQPEQTVIEVKGGKPVGGVKEITLKKDDTLRLTVNADAPEEVHLHGYDIAKDVAPGKPAKFRVKADIEGVFEIELEHSGVQIAELKVEP